MENKTFTFNKHFTYPNLLPEKLDRSQYDEDMNFCSDVRY
jgi:hypothetical protein